MDWQLDFFYSVLRLSTPLLFAAAGGLLAEKSGVATICLEGVLLVSAFASATTTLEYGSPYIGVITGMTAGSLLLLLHGALVLYGKADPIVSGVAINLLASGITPVLTKALFGSSTNTPSLPMEIRVSSLAMVTLALTLPLIAHLILYRTGVGLRLLAAGDGPAALATAGGRVKRTRLVALAVGGTIASLGGIFLAIAHGGQFTRDMSAGRGYIALTALIFGKWKPIPMFVACLFFGFAETLQIQLQGASWLPEGFPIQAIQSLPYLVTLVVLAGFVGESRPPLAIGRSESA